MNKYTIAIAGTTQRTTLCAETLNKSDQFELSWILTPKSKVVGRDKTITPNPLDSFAKKNNIPTIYIEGKINDVVREQILKKPAPDFLLVVDFGYIVPIWLLELPKTAPLNIHPSELPKWRGSSPGQFSILFNDKKSAITLMVINKKLDQGPIIHQDFFNVDPSWTQADYYKHAFELICNGLDEKIVKFDENKNITKPQPEKSPTIVAKMLKKDQAFIEWEVVKIAMDGGDVGMNDDEVGNGIADKASNKVDEVGDKISSKLLLAALKHNDSLALTLERASKAFNPWPYLWTIIPTKKGEKRMKLLKLEVETSNNVNIGEIDTDVEINNTKVVGKAREKNKLVLKTVHIEGKTPGLWSEVSNVISG